MKKTILILTLILLPTVGLAHGGGMMMDFDNNATPQSMMQYVEDQAVGNDEVHEEMESLMTKMIAGQMTESEAGRMAELMDEYPGVHGMMMNRMWDANSSWNKMGWGNQAVPSGFIWLIVVATLLYGIWLIVGVLLIIYLWRKLQNGRMAG